MTKTKWLEQVEKHKEKLGSFIAKWHPGSDERSKEKLPITAPSAECFRWLSEKFSLSKHAGGVTLVIIAYGKKPLRESKAGSGSGLRVAPLGQPSLRVPENPSNQWR